MSKNSNIDSIIAKMLAGTAAAEELAQLEAWKAQDAENAQALQEIIDLHNVSSDMQDYKTYDVDRAWAAVDQASQEPTPESTPIDLFRSKRWLAAAAAAAVAVVALTVLFRGSISTPAPQLAWQAHTQPAQALLPDGSRVHLDRNAAININPSFDSQPTLDLDGRAHFYVAKHNPAAPFTITLDQGQIQVIGTEFTVVDHDGQIEVAVHEGHVQYQLDSRKVDLFAGEKAQVIDNTILKTNIKESDYFDWVKMSLVFKNAPLTSAIQDLQRHFDVEITVDQKVDLSACAISGSYTDQSLTEILNEVASLLDLKYKKDKNGNIRITSVRCLGE